MNKPAVSLALVALLGQLAAPAYAGGTFNETTMLGWQKTSRPAAMAYVRLPFHAGRADASQPRAGFMITAPRGYRVGAMPVRTAAPGVIDFGFTGRNFQSAWTASINVNDAVAWASKPEALPKNATHLFESGASWVVVGLISVGIVAGTIALSDRKK